MWILESDADFLQGRRMWLKPGKKYLFGRVKRDGVRFTIDHKTVSRKHFVISVDNVKKGDTSRIHARTRITVSDEKSKQGTFVDNELLKGDTRELAGRVHSIRPGTFPHEIVIRWVPCVLTFNLTKKEIKADILKSKRARLEELDIKTITDYVSDSTTHVVASKRNTVKGLQALVEAKYIVADSYVDAIVYASTSADLGEEENLSPLEHDFDNAWPKPKDHLPPAGREPTLRPIESYAPDANRNNVFENFTFVFGDQLQYENLLPAITTGHGKALLLNVKNGEMTVEEIVQFMRSTAGEKDFGDAQGGSVRGGTVMVRWNGSEEYRDWTQNLINEVALRLDQRAIDQAEFLDAILANNSFLLRQTVPFASTTDGKVAPPPTPVSSAAPAPIPSSLPNQTSALEGESDIQIPSSVQVSSSPQDKPPASSSGNSAQATQRIASSIPTRSADKNLEQHATVADEVAPPPKRARIRAPPISRFQAFDDGFDADSVPVFAEDDYSDSLPASNSQPQGDGITMNFEKEREALGTSRKRPREPSPEPVEGDELDDGIDDLLPAATAMKRRKLALETEARRKGQPAVPSTKKLVPPPPAIKGKRKKVRDIDVREVAKAQREAEEEAARKEQEDLAEGLGYENDEKRPANLVVIEEIDVPVREARSSRADGVQNERWDPRWNGRKNFKKFRRQGETAENGGGRRRMQNVIVPLVEVKKNSYGIGDKYWDRPSPAEQPQEKRGGEGESGRSRTSKSQSQSQSQAKTNAQTQSGTVQGTATGTDENHDDQDGVMSLSPETKRLQREAAAIVDHAINLDAPRRTRLADKTAQPSQQNTARPSRKRPAAAGSGDDGATTKKKKQKTIQVVRGSDSEDSDDLKFRFGRRKR